MRDGALRGTQVHRLPSLAYEDSTQKMQPSNFSIETLTYESGQHESCFEEYRKLIPNIIQQVEEKRK
uniref:Uncharacterized protein n=1 Tax=Onchocerca volvulus TaxID=6282 RepID=A0A8R1XVR2_ONCVO